MNGAPAWHARAEVVKELEERLARLTAAAARLRRLRIRPSWVVMSAHNIAMAYDVGPDNVLSNPRPARLPEAQRFGLHDAQRVAARTQDANGEPFRAVTLAAAIEVERADTAGVLALLKEWA